jgi:23S rRNA G2445 N2-methylase RlmL
MISFLAKPQKFIVKPAPGWLDLAQLEVCAIIEAPLQKYKFSPEVKISGSSILLSNCDYRQALELVLRGTLIHDVELILHSGRVTTRSGWKEFFEKSKILDVWPAEKRVNLHLMVRVTHPVVGSEKEVRDKLKAYLAEAGVHVANVSEDSGSAARGRVRIESEKNRTQLLMSLAGRPLYIRAYKNVLAGATAPLPEHHAAACFRWAVDEFERKTKEVLHSGMVPVMVPFAGTGTLGFESACQLLQYAPGLFRSDYAFKEFLFNPVKTVSTIERRILSGLKKGTPRVIFGEIDPKVCEDLKANISGFEEKTREFSEDGECVKFYCVQNDFLKDPERLVGSEKMAFFLLNPPYGERLAKKTNSEALYGSLGRVLRKLGQKIILSGMVLCGDEKSWRQFLTEIGTIKHKTRHFTHGGLDVRAVAFSNTNA